MGAAPEGRTLDSSRKFRQIRETAGRALLGLSAGRQFEIDRARGFAVRTGATIIATALAGTVGLMLGRSAPDLTSAPFFPAMLFCTLFGGPVYGAISWIACTALFAVALRQPFAELPLALATFAAIGLAIVAIAAVARAVLMDRERLRSRLFSLLDAGGGFLFVIDAQGRPFEPNPRFAALTGMSWKDYRSRGWEEAIHPDDRHHLPPLERPTLGKSHEAELRFRNAKGEWRWHSMRIVPLLDKNGDIREWVGTLRDIHDRKLDTQKREIVIGELRHRLKNFVAIVESLAKFSAPRPGTDAAIDASMKRYSGRLQALMAASDQLIIGGHTTIEASAVIRATLAPYLGDLAPRIRLHGPEIRLSEHLGGGLAMAVHELATNAIKYGALSVPGGNVHFVWTVDKLPDGEHVVFDWKEHGGPAPMVPDKEGFGMRLIRSVTQREETGAVMVDYEPDGLRCRISFVRRPG